MRSLCMFVSMSSPYRCECELSFLACNVLVQNVYIALWIWFKWIVQVDVWPLGIIQCWITHPNVLHISTRRKLPTTLSHTGDSYRKLLPNWRWRSDCVEMMMMITTGFSDSFVHESNMIVAQQTRKRKNTQDNNHVHSHRHVLHNKAACSKTSHVFLLCVHSLSSAKHTTPCASSSV